MIRLFLILFLSLITSISMGQEKGLYDIIYDRFISSQPDTSRKPSLLALPNVGFSPETGISYGAQVMYTFYADRKDTTNRPSSLGIQAMLGSKKYKNLKINTDVWTRSNKLHQYADMKYRNFLMSYYGIGSSTREVDLDLVREQKVTMLTYAEYKFLPGWYAGIRAGFENYSYAVEEPGGLFTNEGQDAYRNGKVVYIGLQQSLDTRDQIFSATKGYYFSTSYSYAPDFFKGNNFTGGILTADYRTYLKLHSTVVLALNAATQNYFTHRRMPFYLMPQMGNDLLMRGYYQGRFRDQHYTAAQAELRYRFIPRLSVAGFGGLGEVYGKSALSIDNVKPNYGIGLRYFYNLQRNQSVRFDFGFGEKRPGEKRQSGFYFSINEAF